MTAIYKIYCFGLQYITSLANTIPQSLPDGLDEPQPSTSTGADESADLQPEVITMIESRAVQVNILKESADFGCQVNTRGDRLIMKSSDTQTPEVHTCEASTQVEAQMEDIQNAETADPISPEVSPKKDVNYVPLKCDSFSDDASESEEEDKTKTQSSMSPQDDTKFIVFKEKLLKLFKRCLECGAVVTEMNESTQGSQLFITMKCINEHLTSWESQPMIDGMAAGNLLLSSSILLSGATYTKVASLADILKLQFFSEKTFYTIQDKYLFPVVNESWQKEQNSIFVDLKDQDLWLSGDGRCDSPGHNAKYGTYTMIDQETDKIVDFNVVQVSEVNNSNAMEREGFKRCMDNIKARGGGRLKLSLLIAMLVSGLT